MHASRSLKDITEAVHLVRPRISRDGQVSTPGKAKKVDRLLDQRLNSYTRNLESACHNPLQLRSR